VLKTDDGRRKTRQLQPGDEHLDVDATSTGRVDVSTCGRRDDLHLSHTLKTRLLDRRPKVTRQLSEVRYQMSFVAVQEVGPMMERDGELPSRR
jgi:hypothetical protein